ncbi:MAG TPA: hypothetical protein VIW95_01335, partial [Candidatus Binatus sp.]
PNMSDEDVLDIFSRLNSYAVNLNEQEKLNANHFGPFKILADDIGFKYSSYLVKQRVLTAKQILRMKEVALVADLLIAMREGIRSKKQIKKFYDEYEKAFAGSPVLLKARFDRIIAKIDEIFPNGLTQTEFKRPILFYSLFTTVAHCLFRVPKLNAPRKSLAKSVVEETRAGLERVRELFKVSPENLNSLTELERRFLTDCRRATTDQIVRERRTRFLLGLVR